MSITNMFVAAAIVTSTPAMQPVEKINIYAKDYRTPQSQSGVGAVFDPIGAVTTNQKVHDSDYRKGEVPVFTKGSGFLVSPCLLVTNYHVVYGKDAPQPEGTHTVTFTYFDAHDEQRHGVIARPILHGNYDEKPGDDGEDWSVLKLDKCVGEQIGWIEIDHRKRNTRHGRFEAFYHIMIAGYPWDRPSDVLTIDTECTVTDFKDGNVDLETDCALSNGNSGSPVMEVIDGVPKVLAIGQGDFGGGYESTKLLSKFDQYATNNLVDIETVYAAAGKLIVDDLAKRVNPALRNGPYIMPLPAYGRIIP